MLDDKQRSYSKNVNLLNIRDITRWLIRVAVCSLAVGNPGFLRGQRTGAEAQTAKEQTKQPPNILFIYLDDLGYGDVSCLNPHSKITTPNIDRLANEGMSFTDAPDASYSLCFLRCFRAGCPGDARDVRPLSLSPQLA